MKKVDLSQLLQILSNVGVIVGIVFLAVEVRQNQYALDEANVLNRAATLNEATANFGRLRSMLAENADLASIWIRANAGEKLSDVDALRFQQLCQEMLFDMAAVFQRSVALGDEVQAQGIVAGVPRMISRPNWSECWAGADGSISDVMLRTGLEEFVRSVNSQ